ncbi:response regulator transcription factor [Enterobacter bugandensis]|uniref:response regulator transcription factor n=1 Tax=Enterobacter bugandensis TaxID=881260 RepID=UPI0021CF981F|nr:response regulator transcription factor [Enterobacter bugandensis]MCU6172076.1 response regulator transcription factor [Enterobacter bugandensis]MCU6190439.1 response regulator transcription factor [Enterobacter bugandensis]
MNENIIKIMLLDDHPLIIKAWEYTLQSANDIKLLCSCSNKEELYQSLKEHKTDIIVLDYMLGDNTIDGVAVLKHLTINYPEVRVLVSSSVESAAIVNLVLRSGAAGFIGKSMGFEEMHRAIRDIYLGKRYLSPDMQLKIEKLSERDRELKNHIFERSEEEDVKVKIMSLSPRETEVLRCYLSGMSIKEISEKFIRNRKTISGQKQGALRKLGLRSDAELFKYKDYFL